MSLEAQIVTLLSGNVSLSASITGGFYSYESTGRNGVNRDSTPLAYHNGFLRPTILVRHVDETRFGSVRDVLSKARSVRAMIYVFLYDNIVYTVIDAAAALVIEIMNGALISDHGRAEYLRADRRRDAFINNAAMIRVDFTITGIRGDTP